MFLAKRRGFRRIGVAVGYGPVGPCPQIGVARVQVPVERAIGGEAFEQIAFVREKPAESLLYAFIAGYILNRLPIGRILGSLFRLLVIALRPAVLIYGATKLYQAAKED